MTTLAITVFNVLLEFLRWPIVFVTVVIAMINVLHIFSTVVDHGGWNRTFFCDNHRRVVFISATLASLCLITAYALAVGSR